MLERIISFRDKSWAWFSARAHGPHALFWLVILCLTEPIFSPIVPETLLVAMLLAGSVRWKFYAGLTSIASTVGGIAGYFVGALLFSSIGAYLIDLYNLQHAFTEAGRLLGEHIFITMFLVSFTPLPDKVFILAAGFLGAAFFPFAGGYIIGRTLRYYLVSYLVHRYGAAVLAIVNRYIAPIALVSAVIIFLLILNSARFF